MRTGLRYTATSSTRTLPCRTTTKSISLTTNISASYRASEHHHGNVSSSSSSMLATYSTTQVLGLIV